MKRRRPGIAERLRLAAAALRGGSFTLMDDAAADAFGGSSGSGLLLDWITKGGDINDEIRGDMVRVRARARDLAKSNSYIRQFMNMVAVNGIGPTGYAINSKFVGPDGEDGPATDATRKNIEGAWRDWATGPVTVDGKHDLVSAQMMLAKGVVRDGESFARMWRGWPGNEYGLALEIVDPDLVDDQYNRPARVGGDNEVSMGVERDQFGKPLVYHVWDGTLGLTSAGRRERKKIPASDLIHLHLPDRVAQSRGYTCIYPAMIPARMLRGYTDAALVAARAATSKMGFLTPDAGAPAPSEVGGTGPPKQLQWNASPGTIQMLPPGVTFDPWDPQFPTDQFPGFVKAVLREIATGLGVSYNSLANDLDGVNYSSMRSGLLIERDLWKVFHQWWCFKFLSPVYEQWLRTALLTSALRLGSRDFTQYKRVRWTARGWRWVDPLKDVQAGVIGLQSGLASRTQLLDEQGIDFEETLQDLAREKKLAVQYGVVIDGPPHGAVNTVDPNSADQGAGGAADTAPRNRLAAHLNGSGGER